MKRRVFPTPKSNLEFSFMPEIMKNSYQRDILEKHIDESDLFRIFGALHNHIYANDGLSTQQVFDEILKIIFAKIEDETYSGGKYKFFISDHEYDQVQAGESCEFRRRIEELFDRTKSRYSDVFENSDRLKLSNISLAFTVKHFQNYEFKGAEKDIKGAAFQKFVSNNLRRERGQFFTPDPVVNFMTRITKPSSKTKFLDPACGTGSFLYSVIKYVRNNESKNKESDLSSTQFYSNMNGIEINHSVARVAKLRLLLEGFNSSGVLCGNSLLNWKELSEIARKNDFGNYDLKGTYDLILTNPPFGSQGKITDKSFLIRFDLAHRWTKVYDAWNKEVSLQNGQSPEILFLERCIDLLNDEGVLGIVLPNGVFENPSFGYIREYIRKRAKILAVIALPPETFIPHGTGVKASLLFIQRLDEKKLQMAIKNDYNIFFSIFSKIGYEGNKNGSMIYKRNPDGEIVKDSKGKPVIDEDLSGIERDLQLFMKGKFIKNENTFCIKHSEVEDRLDANYYKPEYRLLKEKLVKTEAVRLTDVVDIISQKSQQLRRGNNKIRYVELSDVNPLYGELISYKEMYAYEAPSRASYELKEGYLITAVAGNSTGTKSHASALVTKDFSGCICTNGFRVLRPRNINPFYFLSFLKSDCFLRQMYQKRTGAAIPAVSEDDLKNMLVPLPSTKEQEKIAKKIKDSFELRLRSRKLIDGVSKIFDSELLST